MLGLGRGADAANARRVAPAAGDLFSVSTEDGRFGVVKILATDAGGVHVRLYVERFAGRPGLSELGELSMAAFGPGFDNPFSFGHLPLGHVSFAGWQPMLISRGQSVVEEELVGYRMWQDAEGGYF